MNVQLRTRAITAVFFVAIMLLGMLFSVWSMAILFLIISSVALWEYYRLMKIPSLYYTIIGLLLGLAIHLGVWHEVGLIQLPYYYASTGIVFTSLLAAIMFIIPVFTEKGNAFNNMAQVFFSQIYLSIPLSTPILVSYANQDFQPFIILAALLIIWLNDSGAYLVGSKFGKHPMAPKISPKKTWEGTIGGWIFGTFTAWVISQYTDILSTGNWIAIGLIVSILADIGDLVESKLKRDANVKDSGDILPGHGGVLDRFDSFIFSQPFIYFIVVILG